MTLDELEKRLAKSVPRVAVVLGDPYRVGLAVSRIKEAALEPAFASLNLDTFRAGEDDLSGIPALMRTYPMMARRRVVAIANAEGLVKARGGKALVDALGEIAKKEAIDTCCLIVHGESLDKRTLLAKAAKSEDMLIEFSRIFERDVAGWAKTIAKKYRVKLAADAADGLVQRVGTDLARLDREIEKASLFAGEGATLSAADIAAVSAGASPESIFNLTDALGERHREKALVSLWGVLEAGEEPIGVGARLYRHLRTIAEAREMLDARTPAAQIESELGVHPFVAKKVVNQARAWASAELRRAMHRLTETDFALKDGRPRGGLILEKLVLDLCRPSRGRR
ncbi:DNA polymerase III subunit delta [bacterium]|nr:DNA polymerase III subunit delta [bacterium]